MNLEELIKETFTEHEHVAPDGDAVFAAARQRIDRKRARMSRPLAVAAGVVVLTLAAVTVVLLNRPGSPDNVQVAAPTGETTATTPANPAIPDLTMPYDLGWLPPGEVEYKARRINTGGEDNAPLFGGEYMIEVEDNGQVIDIDVQEFKMTPVDDAAFKSGPGSAVTINGKRGMESAIAGGPAGYELYVEHPDRGSMYVGVAAAHDSRASAQQLIDIGRRIAENIRFPGTTTVTPVFGLGALPNGIQMCAFDVEKGFGGPAADRGNVSETSYDLGTCAVYPTIHINVGRPDDTPATPGQPVQGRETRHDDSEGYLRLFVLDAVHGAPVVVAGKVPLAELYDIANRLVLPD